MDPDCVIESTFTHNFSDITISLTFLRKMPPFAIRPSSTASQASTVTEAFLRNDQSVADDDYLSKIPMATEVIDTQAPLTLHSGH